MDEIQAGGPPLPSDERGAAERRRRRREGDPTVPGFLPESLDRSTIAIPLLDRLDDEQDARAALEKAGSLLPPPRVYDVIIDLHLGYLSGRQGARDAVLRMLRAMQADGFALEVDESKSALIPQYIFARMTAAAVRELARRDNPRAAAPPPPTQVATAAGAGELPPGSRAAAASDRAIYRIWPDFEVRAFITKSVSTVKADAARSAFAAVGADIVWAVIDSGIDAAHPHFDEHKNLELTPPLQHYDFSIPQGTPQTALTDEAGHGTHVAGIIAGEIPPASDAGGPVVRAVAATRHWNEHGAVEYATEDIYAICGMAPKCKLVSMKVLDKNGRGLTSSIIAAIEQIQQINGYGRRLVIHGVNLSVGYDFQPEWFACGQSPLCVEVDRLVRSGVVVVASSGNTGYGFQTTKFEGTVAAGMSLSINDPGNADLAITVGSTHRDMPHTYGVSYFSSKGPTGDGRPKPDLVAPGEKVLSCAAGVIRDKANQQAPRPCGYVEQSGTSMAAPHVSGVVAALLSVRREFIGQPEAVKQIFTSTATDLKRDRYFQGSGLVDLMRAIQSI